MDIVCFSHLRWDFVFQRPQHLLTRLAAHFRIFYVEEPSFHADTDSYSDTVQDNVHIIRMNLKGGPHDENINERQQRIIRNLLITQKMHDYVLWYYTPMALRITAGMEPVATVYDCMDELSAFRFAPPTLKHLERELLGKADIVFTGGHSLYAAKKHQHPNIHSFPSSIDKKHFMQARNMKKDPEDQVYIPHPRFGFYGVIDERFDIELIRGVAEKRPDWHIVLVGPVVKIDPATLPRNSNIHYLGGKTYNELPGYLGGWDIAMVSFALNESTKFISPTKTPEYLAGGRPVISTSIKDVVETYGNNDLVHIANSPDEFISVAEKELAQRDKRKWLQKVDNFIADDSWENTVGSMRKLLYEAIANRQMLLKKKPEATIGHHYLQVKGSLPAAS
jgi:glycosyltransferase involved in cell wall biosynthesis